MSDLKVYKPHEHTRHLLPTTNKQRGKFLNKITWIDKDRQRTDVWKFIAIGGLPDRLKFNSNDLSDSSDLTDPTNSTNSTDSTDSTDPTIRSSSSV